MSNFRKRDHNGEQVIHKFLCEYFYPLLFKNIDVTNKEEQLSGIDMKCFIDEVWVNIDEKTQLTKLNEPVLTQCLELSSYQSNKLVPGWVFNEATDYYLFTHIPECTVYNPYDLNDINQIKRMRAILISKENILFMLQQNNLSLERLKEDGKALTNNNFSKETNTHYYRYYLESKDIWLCKTKESYLSENPTNIIVRWSQYEKYASHIYDITPHRIKILK